MIENENAKEKLSGKYQKNVRNTFCIDGHNGAALVEPVLVELGWLKMKDKGSDDFRLKWTELVSQINYSTFREGEQLVNHIPNCGMITNKLGLLTSLRSHDKMAKELNRSKTLEMDMFVPETYIIDDLREREQFFNAYKVGDIWINKPTGLNQGKGITLIRDLGEFRKELDERDNFARSAMTGVKARIVQRYLSNPLLLKGRKFDIRSYMYIASTSPYLVLYCPGYIRLSMNPYSNEDTDLITHLTNQYIQKKSPNYGDVKEDTIWSMDKFNEYLNSEYASTSGYKHDWVRHTLERQMQQIMIYVFNSVKNKMATRVGFFELYGFDFMVDSSFKIWLIEVNVNPALHVNCTLLNSILPPMIEEVILLAIECFEKTTKLKKSLVPLENAKIFTVIYSESTALCKSRMSAYSSLKSWIPPRYRSHSISPNRIKTDEKGSSEASYAPIVSARAQTTRGFTFSNVITSSREIPFESTLRNYHRESSNMTKSEYIFQGHNRMRSSNLILSTRKHSQLNSLNNLDPNITIQHSTDTFVVGKEMDFIISKDRVTTNVNYESLKLAPSKHKTDLFNPNRNYNPIRKTPPVRAREPAPITVVQVVTGSKPDGTADTKSNKVKMSEVIIKNRTKIYDRSS